MGKWKKYKFSDFLKRVKEPITINDADTYKRVTIKTKHAGVSLRDTEIGSKIGTKRQFVLRSGQFVLSKIDARYGAFGIAPEEVDEAIITGNFWAYDVDEEIIWIQWLNHFTNSASFYDICERASSGITHRKYLKEKQFLNNDIWLPDIDSQTKIITKIEKKNEHISTLTTELTHQQTLLDKLRQAILQEAIEGKLTAEWRKQNPPTESAAELLARIRAEKAALVKAKKIRKQKKLAPITPEEIPFELPAGWVWCYAVDIGFVMGGITKNSTKNSTENFLPYLRVANVYANELRLDDIKTIGVSDSKLDRYLLEKDDLLIVEGNGSYDQIGRIAIWDGSIPECIHQNHVIKLRLIDTTMAVWLLNWFLSPIGRTLIQDKARTSTGLYNLSVGKIKRLLVALPPLAEQQAIVAKVERLLAVVEALAEQNLAAQKSAGQLMQAVLKEAFQSNGGQNGA